MTNNIIKHFSLSENGITFDSRTTIEWIAGHNKNTNWFEAKEWAGKQNIDGGNWRFPKLEELRTLYMKGHCINNMPLFLENGGTFIWSGEENGSNYAWGFDFKYGDCVWASKSNIKSKVNARVFAVRRYCSFFLHSHD